MKVQSSKEAVVTQHSKDGGIDGYINADGFGIKKLCCFQAKKWDAAVGVKIVRELVGSLAEMRCRYCCNNIIFQQGCKRL